jgi:phosphocarrier protein
VLLLPAGRATPRPARPHGPDEDAALAAVVALFARKFDEGT